MSVCPTQSLAREYLSEFLASSSDFDTLACKGSVGDRVSVSGIRGGWGSKVQGLVAGWLKTETHNTTSLLFYKHIIFF